MYIFMFHIVICALLMIAGAFIGETSLVMVGVIGVMIYTAAAYAVSEISKLQKEE